MLIATIVPSSAAGFHRVAMAWTLALLVTVASCKSPTSTYDDPATLSLLSGGNQTVTINPAGLADLPQPVVVRLARNGKLMPYSGLSVKVSSAVSSAPPRLYAFVTGADGTATMQLQADNTPGPFNIDVSYWICSGGSLQNFCPEAKTLATLRVTGTAVN
jgi:hypothetical protein